MSSHFDSTVMDATKHDFTSEEDIYKLEADMYSFLGSSDVRMIQCGPLRFSREDDYYSAYVDEGMIIDFIRRSIIDVLEEKDVLDVFELWGCRFTYKTLQRFCNILSDRHEYSSEGFNDLPPDDPDYYTYKPPPGLDDFDFEAYERDLIASITKR